MVQGLSSKAVKKNYWFQIRLDKEQKERLEALASASGYKCVSDYVRITLLNPSIELKINKIITLLEQNKQKNEGYNGK